MKKILLILSTFILSWLIFTSIYAVSDSSSSNEASINNASEDKIEAKYKKIYAEKMKYFKNELKQDWNFHSYKSGFWKNSSHFNKWWKWHSWHWIAWMIWFVIFKIIFWIVFVSATTFLVRRVWDFTWKSDFLKCK